MNIMVSDRVVFFFNVELGIVALVMTDLLSQKTWVGPSIGMLNIHNVYLRDSTISTSMHIGTNFEPNMEDFMVFCTLENQRIGAQLR
jgi:hypothetical protein